MTVLQSVAPLTNVEEILHFQNMVGPIVCWYLQRNRIRNRVSERWCESFPLTGGLDWWFGDLNGSQLIENTLPPPNHSKPPISWREADGVVKWVWLRIKQLGLRRFWSLFPYTKVPFWISIFFQPQPYGRVEAHVSSSVWCLLFRAGAGSPGEMFRATAKFVAQAGEAESAALGGHVGLASLGRAGQQQGLGLCLLLGNTPPPSRGFRI